MLEQHWKVYWRDYLGTTLKEEEVEVGEKGNEIRSFIIHAPKISGFSFSMR